MQLHRSQGLLLRALAISLIGMALAGCATSIPSVICDDWDFDCYVLHAGKTRAVVETYVAYWSNAHLITRICIVVLGIVATVMIALQGDENKVWTRPIGLIATTLVTGLTTALVSFHVPENIDKLVDIQSTITNDANEFAFQAEKIKGGKIRRSLRKRIRPIRNFENPPTISLRSMPTSMQGRGRTYSD